MSVTLGQASTIVDTALKKGRDTNCAPLTVAVLDAGGHLVAFKREDKSGLLRFDIAFGKAWGALGMGFGSRTLAARAAKINTVILPKLNERDLVDVPEPIKRDMQFHFVEHVEDVLRIALLDKDAAGEKTTERAGRESKPLPEPVPASVS